MATKKRKSFSDLDWNQFAFQQNSSKRRKLDTAKCDDSKQREIESNHDDDEVLSSMVSISKKLRDSVNALAFSKPLHIYNPLNYAWNGHYEYLKRITSPKRDKATCHGKVLLLGMNPGPFGCVQTGVPFGDTSIVSNWMNIKCEINIPPKSEQHPKRPILGFGCQRKGISGQRLWSWAAKTFGADNSDHFFSKCFIYNHCPLYFIANENGKNLIPEKLEKTNRNKLFEICDDSLIQVIHTMRPSFVIGIGNFAHKRAVKIKQKMKVQRNGKMHTSFKIGKILHPSPASPLANNFEIEATKQINALGVTW